MSKKTKIFIDKNPANCEAGFRNETGTPNHWTSDLKNILSAVWPLFLYIGITSVVLLYLGSK